ncbi:hypothetical protein ACSSS7_002334 [Eimeria intestinalis]
MEDSSKKVTRSTTPPSRDTSRSTTSPTSRSASEAPSLRGRRVSCGPHSSDSSVVLGILQNIAQQTVEQAIVQHQQRGGKAVSGARVRITPGGSVRIGQEEKGEAAIPQVVQEFTVVPSQDENGNEVTAVTPAAQLVDPNFSAAYETSPSISTFPPMNDIYGLNTIGGRHVAVPGPSHLTPPGRAADCQSFSGSAKSRNLPGNLKELIKDILKLWATKACYQDAARAVKAWMTRHRCSYSEGATEELAVREVPQQYEKYRNLGRATEKLQRQLEAKLSSTILQPVHQVPTTEREATLKAITKTCNKLAAAHKDDAARTSRGEAACDAVERARSQELYEERDHLLARVAAQQEMLRQLSEVNQRQIAELVKLKGRHRALCKITPGVESLRLSSASADVSRVFVKPQGISTLLVKTQPAVRQHATSRGYAPHNKTRVFEFDHVYDEKRTTYDIYEDLKELTASVLAGNIL